MKHAALTLLLFCGSLHALSYPKSAKSPLTPVLEAAWPAADSSASASADIDAAANDRIVFRYDKASDSGVEVERTVKDSVIWRAHVSPLGVEHPKYTHSVIVRVDGEKVLITSKGAATITEVLDAASGTQTSRKTEWPQSSDPKTPPTIEEAWDQAVDGTFLKGEFFDLDAKKRDRLYLRYGPIRDSGVELERIVDGKVLWRVHFEPLGVIHSKYNHSVNARIDDGKVLVTSIGARRIFESRDLKTGRLLLRNVDDNP
jgi:hypothetical protein